MYQRRKSLAVLSLLVVLAVTFMAPATGAAQGPDNRFTASPLAPDTTYSVTKVIGADGQKMVPVIVELEAQPVATYSGGVPGLAPTSPKVTGAQSLDLSAPASQAYQQHINRQHENFKQHVAAAVPTAKVTQESELVLNSVTVLVPADQVAELAGLPDVKAVYPDTLLHLQTDNSPQFIGAPTAWAAAGGQESAGENVIVGVIDTGIWPEHPSFSDPDPSGKPYGPPPPAPASYTRKCEFSVGANPGPAFACNNKLIAAYLKMGTYNALVKLLPDEYTSARDSDGHGTHTASTSAGNGGVQAAIFGVPRGTISGIAPRARVIAYHVCGASGCYSSDSVSAVDQAIKDGVNVINFSISGGANPFSDAVEQAFLNAYNAGIFVAASAGNSGPAPETTDHRGPWTTTVAASTQNRAFETTGVVTGGGASLSLTGTSITSGIAAATPVVVAADPLCIKPFAPGTFTGKVVVCMRGGGPGRAEKGYNVLQGGAAGMILYNNAANVTDLETDNHYLPAFQIQFDQGQALLAFLSAHPGATVTWPAGAKVASQGDVMASFSSRGGPGQTLGVSKPDITAPGVSILAGHSPQHLAPPDGVALGPQGESFQAIAGTSMSSPHIAGAGAMIKALHPDWTPGQIKSALMTTAWTNVLKEDGTSPANAFDDGSGRVDLNVAGDPGLTISDTAANFVARQSDLWNANYPSVYIPVMAGAITLQRTVHSVLPSGSNWELKVVGATNKDDWRVTVPETLSVPAGGDASFDIKIDARDVPLGQVRFATIWLSQQGSERKLHIPVTIVRKQAAVTLTKTCDPATIAVGATTTCTITAANTTFNAANVKISDQLPKQLKLVPGSVVKAAVLKNGITFQGTLAAAEPPDVQIAAGSSPAGGYLPLASLGIAPISGMGDETAFNFSVPDFTFGGETYSRLGVVSDGYLIVGGAAGSADIQFENQKLPDPTRPNNVLAPFWTDLNPAFGGTVRVGILGDGADTWIVVDYAAVREYTAAKTASFEIWIGVNGDAHPGEDVSFAFGAVEGNGEAGALTTGAENKFGSRGQNYYYNGTGTLPANGTQLRVTTVPGKPGESRTITFKASGDKWGPYANYAEMTSNLFQGTNIARFAGEVTKVTPNPQVDLSVDGSLTRK